ncbi:glycosyltransferase family 29 protein [Sphingomonas sp. ID0503]|uniref:glycosyltransferase family 29 protein n=1 Tax=Sphingomonas sp. ID0503 TaxID=3399691 RepID=UPI003AFB7F34
MPLVLVRALTGLRALLGRRAPPDLLASAEQETAALPPWVRWAVWRRVYAQRPTAAVAIRYARALVEGLRYEEAFAVLDAAKADPGVRRARVRLLERTGALTAAAEMAEEPGEIVRLSREAGLPVLAETVQYRRERVEDSRAEAAALIVANRHGEAVEKLAAVFAKTGKANDLSGYLNAVLLSGDVAAGGGLAREGARRFPQDPRFPRKLAQLAEREGEWEAATLAYRAAHGLDPASAVERCGIARTLAMAGELAAARRWLDVQSDDDLSFWVEPMRAFIAMRAGQERIARAALDRAYGKGEVILSAYRAARAAGEVYLLDGVTLRHPLERYRRSADLFDEILRGLQGGSVALVGNSPKLRGEGLGPTIDAHGSVVRINDFRLAGFEPDVGRRTDIWLSSANRQAEPDPDGVAGAKSILIQSHALHVPELPAFAMGRMRLNLGPEQACFLPPFLHRLSDALLYPVPTTGMRALLMLEFVMQTPFRALGFDFFESAEMHYFDRGPTRHRVGESHAIAFERAFAAEVLGTIGRFVRF